MRYPKPVKRGGTIGFVAPSFGCATEPYLSAFQNAQKKWKEMGYELKLGPNCYTDCGIGISNTPKACGEELTSVYCDPNVNGIISCGGGEMMCEILGYVDFDLLSQSEPKWYMGYSDNTNFTFLNTTLCDTASIYGPCASSFGMEPWHQVITDAFSIFDGTAIEHESVTFEGYDLWEKEGLKDEDHPLAPINVTEPSLVRAFIHGGNGYTELETVDAPKAAPGETDKQTELSFQGRLLGGCLDCLVNLCGTKYDRVGQFVGRYSEDGFIWFLEACDLNVMGIRRAMWKLREAGWFEHCRGFVIGRPLCFGQEMMGLDQYHAVLDIVEPFGVPVIMDADLGHLPPSMPIICGSMGEAAWKDGKWSLRMELK